MSHPPLDVKEMVEAFSKYDREHKKGRGESESADSGSLGWGESGFLDAYAKLYEVTGETRWLDKIADHFDRILGQHLQHVGMVMPSGMEFAGEKKQK